MLELLAFILVQYVYAKCDNSKVVTLPVRDVTLSNNKVMRGIPLSVGTPPQAFALMPQPFFNDTWIYNKTAPFCNDLEEGFPMQGCLTERGGLYESTSSSTATDTRDVYKAGGDPSDTIDVIGQEVDFSSFVNDNLIVGGNVLKDFPIGMPGTYQGSTPNTYYNTQGALGVGPNSTLLNSLLHAGRIGSRSYSWWWGLTGATKYVQMDGQMVLGGYDAAKAKGQNYTKALAPPSQACHSGMVVTMSDIGLSFPNGTTSSISSPNLVDTCILPHYPLTIFLPWEPYYSNFEGQTQSKNLGHGGGAGLTFLGMLYPTDKVYEGDLIFTFDNNFQITIPNDQLVVPPMNVKPDGSIFTNHSVAEVLISPTTGTNHDDFAILGRHFFQAAYLTVDLDAQTFTISQANAVANSDIVALGGDCSSPHVNTPASGARGANSNVSSGSDKNGSKKGVSWSTGTIAGVVVGGILVVIFTTSAILIFCLRRRRGVPEKAMSRDSSTASGHPSQDCTAYNGHETFASGSHEAMSNNVVEMQAERRQQELPAHSRPLELSTEKASQVRQQRFLTGLNSPVELA